MEAQVATERIVTGAPPFNIVPINSAPLRPSIKPSICAAIEEGFAVVSASCFGSLEAFSLAVLAVGRATATRELHTSLLVQIIEGHMKLFKDPGC